MGRFLKKNQGYFRNELCSELWSFSRLLFLIPDFTTGPTVADARGRFSSSRSCPSSSFSCWFISRERERERERRRVRQCARRALLLSLGTLRPPTPPVEQVRDRFYGNTLYFYASTSSFYVHRTLIIVLFCTRKPLATNGNVALFLTFWLTYRTSPLYLCKHCSRNMWNYFLVLVVKAKYLLQSRALITVLYSKTTYYE